MNARLSQRPGDTGEASRLRAQLTEARATLQAIRNGEVDAVVVDGRHGPRVYTLDSAEFDYRVLIESMNEGALVLTLQGVILYANRHFSLMVARPLAQVIGSSLHEFLGVEDQAKIKRLLKSSGSVGTTGDVSLQSAEGAPTPVRVSLRRLPRREGKEATIGMVVTDTSDARRREDLLRAFSHSLMQLQERERMQIAAHLGDNISQALCSVLLRYLSLTQRLPAAEAESRQESIDFAALLRSAASEVHRISADLRPHGLEILGLVSALRAAVADFAERTGISIHVSCPRESLQLPAGADLALYRVLQEALRNVEEHAHARHAAVALRRRGAVVQLRVRDDGVGFDTRVQQSKGMDSGQLGLLTMRERATAAGGELTVKSSARRGTEVCMSVPLARSAVADQSA